MNVIIGIDVGGSTTKIVGYYQEIFSDDLNYRCIPIALVNRERGAAALLISPLLVESLEELFVYLL